MAYVTLNEYDWKVYVLICMIPVPIFVLLAQWLPESLRFLQHTHKHDRLLKILHKVGKENSVITPTSIDLSVDKLSNINNKIWILFSKQYAKTTISLIIIWISILINYCGLVLMNT